MAAASYLVTPDQNDDTGLGLPACMFIADRVVDCPFEKLRPYANFVVTGPDCEIKVGYYRENPLQTPWVLATFNLTGMQNCGTLSESASYPGRTGNPEIEAGTITLAAV